MRYVLQLLIIIAFSFTGEMLHELIPLPFPASIYGIILLFICLELKIVRVRHIREAATTLIAAMPVMFVPPAVGLMNTWDAIRDSWPKYLVITVFSTLVVMAAAGWATQLVIRFSRNQQQETQKHKNEETKETKAE